MKEKEEDEEAEEDPPLPLLTLPIESAIKWPIIALSPPQELEGRAFYRQRDRLLRPLEPWNVGLSGPMVFIHDAYMYTSVNLHLSDFIISKISTRQKFRRIGPWTFDLVYESYTSHNTSCYCTITPSFHNCDYSYFHIRNEP